MSAFGGVRHGYEGFGFDDRPRRQPRFDDDEGAPRPINSRTPKKAKVGGVCTMPQTMDAVMQSGRHGNRQQVRIGTQITTTSTRQAKPKGRAARKREQRELKTGKKGGKR